MFLCFSWSIVHITSVWDRREKRTRMLFSTWLFNLDLGAGAWQLESQKLGIFRGLEIGNSSPSKESVKPNSKGKVE